MMLEELVTRYIQSAEQVLAEVKVAEEPVRVDERKVKDIVDEAKRYLEDAKYYRDGERYETSLASVAYCEGLLDALRLLGAVEFALSLIHI